MIAHHHDQRTGNYIITIGPDEDQLNIIGVVTIAKTVARVAKCTIGEILGYRRQRAIVNARFAAIAILAAQGYRPDNIARVFRSRSACAITYAIRAAQVLRETDRQFSTFYNAVEQAVYNKP